jgi:5-methylthioadenosine/S-adenosylhomocysteine deaminase
VVVFHLIAVPFYVQPGGHREIVDILITNGMVVTMDAERKVLERGTVAIKDGAIVAVGTSDSLKNRFRARKIIDARSKLIMPGLVNHHPHVAMTLFREFADDLSLQDWLEKHIWPLESKYIHPETVRNYWMPEPRWG